MALLIIDVGKEEEDNEDKDDGEGDGLAVGW